MPIFPASSPSNQFSSNFFFNLSEHCTINLIYLSIYLSLYLCYVLNPSLFLFIYSFINVCVDLYLQIIYIIFLPQLSSLPAYLSFSTYLSIYLCVHLTDYISIYLSIRYSVLTLNNIPDGIAFLEAELPAGLGHEVIEAAARRDGLHRRRHTRWRPRGRPADM